MRKPLILIVDDTALYRNLLGNVLDKDYQVIFAIDGAQTLEKCAVRAPDIIFLDDGLPDSKGHEIIHLILEMLPKTAIIMVTGNREAKTIKKSLEHGALGYILKPFSKAQIEESINKWRQKFGDTEPQVVDKKFLKYVH